MSFPKKCNNSSQSNQHSCTDAVKLASCNVGQFVTFVLKFQVIGDKKLGIDEQHFPVYEGDNVIGTSKVLTWLFFEIRRFVEVSSRFDLRSQVSTTLFCNIFCLFTWSFSFCS